jgi:G3E family GTPase
VLRWMPVAQNAETGNAAPAAGASPIKAVLRSKGFMWMSHNHMTAFYWSHAGQHFEIRDEGDWCGPPRACSLCLHWTCAFFGSQC